MKYIIILLTVFLLKSCGNTKDIENTKEDNALMKIEQLSGTYLITMFGRVKLRSKKLTLELDESTNKVSVFGGCNSFFGTFNANGNHITFNELVSTRKMCSEENMEAEQYMMDALAQTTRYSLEKNILNLKNETSSLMSAKKVQEKIMITYETSTRGFYEIIWISKDSISFSNDRNLKERKTSDCPEKEWNELLALLQNINIKSLSELEAPTKKHQYDGAAMATLKVESEGEIYSTNIFDHGYPPKEIEELVNIVLSMKKMSTKE